VRSLLVIPTVCFVFGCTQVADPSETSGVTTCRSNSDCPAASHACQRISPGPEVGMCAQNCDSGGGFCGSGETCLAATGSLASTYGYRDSCVIPCDDGCAAGFTCWGSVCFPEEWLPFICEAYPAANGCS
jgi:hypothetical protein